MLVYTAQFAGVSVSASQDLFEIPSTAGYVTLLGLHLFQYGTADYGNSEAEGCSLQVIRGGTTGSGGSTVVAKALEAMNTATGPTLEINNTSVGGGSPDICWSWGWNVQAGEPMWWPEGCQPKSNSQIVQVRMTAPNDAITLNGTLTFGIG